jgi:hypothetical protein
MGTSFIPIDQKHGVSYWLCRLVAINGGSTDIDRVAIVINQPNKQTEYACRVGLLLFDRDIWMEYPPEPNAQSRYRTGHHGLTIVRYDKYTYT